MWVAASFCEIKGHLMCGFPMIDVKQMLSHTLAWCLEPLAQLDNLLLARSGFKQVYFSDKLSKTAAAGWYAAPCSCRRAAAGMACQWHCSDG
jgi:hypothetical protein